MRKREELTRGARFSGARAKALRAAKAAKKLANKQLEASSKVPTVSTPAQRVEIVDTSRPASGADKTIIAASRPASGANKKTPTITYGSARQQFVADMQARAKKKKKKEEKTYKYTSRGKRN